MQKRINVEILKNISTIKIFKGIVYNFQIFKLKYTFIQYINHTMIQFYIISPIIDYSHSNSINKIILLTLKFIKSSMLNFL